MKDRLSLITGAIVAIILVVAIIVVVSVANSGYKSKNADLEKKITEIRGEINALKDTKDSNNFTPEELVKAFLGEVKADSAVKQKLYLSAAAQNMDVKNTLKLGADLANMTIGDSEQNINGESADVSINLEVGANQVARTFSLIREDGAWKINGVVAE